MATSTCTQEAPPSRMSSDEKIAAHIEWTIASIIQAINNRHFDSTLPPWTTITPSFSMPTIAFRNRCTSREDYIEGFKKLAAAYPNFSIEPLEMWTCVYRSSGYAELYLTAQSTGGPTLPSGMKRKAIGRHEFRRVEGRWLLVGETSILGIGDGIALEEGER